MGKEKKDRGSSRQGMRGRNAVTSDVCPGRRATAEALLRRAVPGHISVVIAASPRVAPGASP